MKWLAPFFDLLSLRLFCYLFLLFSLSSLQGSHQFALKIIVYLHRNFQWVALHSITLPHAIMCRGTILRYFTNLLKQRKNCEICTDSSKAIL